jgi:hypothetical protein
MILSSEVQELRPGEFYVKKRFGPRAVNRGAVLLECEWSGGVFESGMMLGGLFRSGEFRGGTFSGAVFWDGFWLGGTWHCGYDRRGRYRPRTDRPPHRRRASRPPEGSTGMPRLLIASPHRYPDLARLWHRSVARQLVPAFEAAGFEVRVLIFRDANEAAFDPAHFPGVDLDAPHSGARDFIEFYDAALGLGSDYLLFLDADVFFLDGPWAASHVGAFDDPDVAAVSFLHRPELPGSVYALLCRCEPYRRLSPPVFASCYEDIDDWPKATHRDPGELAAIRLRRSGRTILEVDPSESEAHLADFHSTTNVRVSRELFGGAIGAEQFDALVSSNRYFAMGAYDNALLGALHEALFAGPFAPGEGGDHLGGSVPVESLKGALGRITDPALLGSLRAYFSHSDRCFRRVAAREGLTLPVPLLTPDGWEANEDRAVLIV